MIDLPSVGKAAKQPDRIIQILVGNNDTLELKSPDRTVSLKLGELASTVNREQGKDGLVSTAVVISADRNVKYESVVKVMDTLQRAGVQRVGLSVKLLN
jgi:biopolymer transport protein TolR